MSAKRGMLIWWTNQADCEAIDDDAQHSDCTGELHSRFPEYLCDQYRNRYGRDGSGRLWVADRFGVGVKIENWPKTPLGQLLGEKLRLGQTYAGIVIRYEDACLLHDMPGVITDLYLERTVP